MKIQCDVCSSAEASVFCCADEAALCDHCDRRVHRANKLAGKHRRFSLLQPTTTSSSSPTPRPLPLCDICQERRGFVFCQEDRAILCRDCDAPIHTASSLTMKHSRFLITGVHLSPAPIPPSSSSAEAEITSSKTCKKDQEKAVPSEAALLRTAAAAATSSGVTTTATTTTNDSSSISEYLTKMLPGWHVEDFLTDDSSATTADSFCQVDEVAPFLGAEEFSMWVPRVPPAAAASGGGFHQEPGLGRSKEASPSHHRLKESRRRWSEDTYSVPQIQHECEGNKRSRPSIWYF